MKKILLGLASVVVIAGGIAAMSAGEAHIINVTAHIENALSVHPTPLDFKTVFPEQYKELQLTVQMSDSFELAPNADDVEYKIVQKPKCICNDPDEILCKKGEHASVDRITHACPKGFIEMPLLCPYLSKLDGDPEDQNDKGVPSYYVASPSGDFCQTPSPAMATGKLAKSQSDLIDLWNIDLKVPPFKGYVAQDWPASCPVLTGDPDGTDYGCDLWIESTYISEFPI